MNTILTQIIPFVQKIKEKVYPKKDLADSCYHKRSTDVKDLLQSKIVITKLT